LWHAACMVVWRMPSVETKYFATLSYAAESVFNFPEGLPGFEEQKDFVLIDLPDSAPLVYLQSLTRVGLCFLAFPIQVVDRNYQLAIAPEDLEELALDPHSQPVQGHEALVLALISLHDGLVATANLMAPIALNLRTRRGLQAIRRDTLYSHQHPIAPLPARAPGPEQAAPEKTC
jgi:flagellar assembly factor FliW